MRRIYNIVSEKGVIAGVNLETCGCNGSETERNRTKDDVHDFMMSNLKDKK